MKPNKRPKVRRGLLAGALLLATLASGCGSSRLTAEQASTLLEPKAELPASERVDQPANLIVKIRNVADERSSFKNHVRLYVNGIEILPNGRVDNMTNIYSYQLRLREGVYEVRAEYYNLGGFRTKKYKIVPDEPVKILPAKRTILDVDLDKDEMGGLLESPTHFRLRYEDLELSARFVP